MNPGQDVTVTYQGLDHPGEIIQHHHGWILARIAIDPEADYGSITARLTPHTLVMVRQEHVNPTP